MVSLSSHKDEENSRDQTEMSLILKEWLPQGVKTFGLLVPQEALRLSERSGQYVKILDLSVTHYIVSNIMFNFFVATPRVFCKSWRVGSRTLRWSKMCMLSSIIHTIGVPDTQRPLHKL